MVGFLLLLTAATSAKLYAQKGIAVFGKIVEEKSSSPIPFATILLFKESKTGALPCYGTACNSAGEFTVKVEKAGSYRLVAKSTGYKMAAQHLSISATSSNIGTIKLQDSTFTINEMVVVAERIGSKSEKGKNVYYINRKTLEASSSTADLLRHIPSVQVDLKHNISVDNHSNVLIYVNGKERDKSYIDQLNPSQIDRVEIISTPPSSYEGNVSGIINIILKKDKKAGLSGQLFSEIPTSKSEVYLFPTYSISYGIKNINLYTSYNGEINYENIDECLFRKVKLGSNKADISTIQRVRQKNISHKVHYGIDYHATPNDLINIYGFYNPYSYEQNGTVNTYYEGDYTQKWSSSKKESDSNESIFSSIYYQHKFNKEGQELSVDISRSSLASNNTITYQGIDSSKSIQHINQVKPRHSATTVKVDFSTPLSSDISLGAGVKMKTENMHDNLSTNFRYTDKIYALYTSIRYKPQRYDISMGLRAEDAEKNIPNVLRTSTLSLLPYANLKYELSKQQSIQLTFRRSVNRASMFQLNPYVYADDPYSVRKGNMLLQQEFRTLVKLEYATQTQRGSFTPNLFYERITNVLGNLTTVSSSNIFETQIQNMGTIQQYGVQLLGTFRYGILSTSYSLRLYHQQATPSSLPRKYSVDANEKMVFDSGVSAILSFKHSFALSAILQYSTTKYSIQNSNFSDALYFINVDKTFRNNLKVGIVSALPLAINFVYQGSDFSTASYSSHYTGNLKLSTFPLMFRIGYTFSTGQSRSLTSRDKEEVIQRTKPGL